MYKNTSGLAEILQLHFQFFVLEIFNIEVKITRNVRKDIQHIHPEFRVKHYGCTRQQEQITYCY